MIKYVFMDIDDTLLDFGKAEAAAIKKTFERIGVPATPEVISRYSEINDEHWKMLERGELTREQVLVYRFDALFAELGIKNVPSEMAQASYEYLLGIGHYFVDGAPELLEALKGKYELYIVSNGTASVQDSRLEARALRRISRTFSYPSAWARISRLRSFSTLRSRASRALSAIRRSSSATGFHPISSAA